MRRRLLLFAGVMATGTVLLALVAPTPSQDRFDRARAHIRQRLVDEPIPSISVAVARDGKILWEEGFGWADRENRIAATEHTVYSLASISKPFTATGLMVLVGRGKVALDKPINDYLGEAKLRARVGNAADATVRRVANHSSGLPLHYQFFYEDEPVRPPSMDETILRYGNLVTPPDERFQYSNLGYGILDYVITRAAGKKYEDFMREEVFLPLGLTHTSVGIAPGLEKHAAVRYNREGMRLPFYDFDHRGGSAVFSSAHDLVRFGLFHLKAHLPEQRAILPDDVIEEMQKPTKEHYGIGWGVREVGGLRIVSHGGGMPGVSTALWLLPAERIAVAVLINTSGADPSPTAREILAAVLPNVPPLPPPNPPPAQEFKPGPELAGEWSGTVSTYQGDRTLTLRIEPSGLVRARLGQQLETLVNSAGLRDGYLTGRMAGDIGTDDAARRPHSLLLSLRPRGEVLNGAVTALSNPGPRGGNAVTYWAELKRVPTEKK